MNPIEIKIAKAVNKHFELTERTKRLISLASWDIYSGPLQGCDQCGADNNFDCTCVVKWPGFEKATDELSQWVSENVPHVLYFDADCDYISETLPEGEEDPETGEYVEPFLEETYEVSRKEILRAIFGRELAQYVGG